LDASHLMIEQIIEHWTTMKKFGAPRLRGVGESLEVSPEHDVFEEMVEGWRPQRLARNLALATVDSGARVLRRFCHEVRSYPWQWSRADLENWVADLRTTEGRAPTRRFAAMTSASARLRDYAVLPVAPSSTRNLTVMTSSECDLRLLPYDQRRAGSLHLVSIVSQDTTVPNH
jgi:hypothetical protein